MFGSDGSPLVEPQPPVVARAHPDGRPVGSLGGLVLDLADVSHKNHIRRQLAHPEVLERQSSPDAVAFGGEGSLAVVPTPGATELQEVSSKDALHVLAVEASLSAPQRLFELSEVGVHGDIFIDCLARASVDA